MPYDFYTYIYRIGRTGRIKIGYATSFVNEQTDNKMIKEIIEVMIIWINITILIII